MAPGEKGLVEIITAKPRGFDRPNPARERKWSTKTSKANFVAPNCLSEDPDLPRRSEAVLTLITVRSNDQFNTTVYGYEDRLRGIYGTRKVVDLTNIVNESCIRCKCTDCVEVCPVDCFTGGRKRAGLREDDAAETNASREPLKTSLFILPSTQPSIVERRNPPFRQKGRHPEGELP